MTTPAAKQRRGWLHMATSDVELREQLRHIDSAMITVSALDIVDGLVGVCDAFETHNDRLTTLARQLYNSWRNSHGCIHEHCTCLDTMAEAKALNIA